MTGLVNVTVAGLTFRQLFNGRRLAASAFFAAAPLVLTLFFVAHPSTTDPTGVQFLRELYSGVVAFVLLPLSAVVFGTAAFGGEIDDGTIVYLLVKSLPRWQLVLTKYSVAVLATVALMFGAILLPWLVLGARPESAPLVEAYAVGIAIGAALYCAIFVTLGLVSKRALVIGLLYIVVLEIVLSQNVVGLKSVSVREFVMTVVGQLAAGTPGVKAGAVPVSTAWTMGAVILVASLGIGVRWISRYQLEERV